ncbi:PAS domain S-box protein [Adhaeribacter sp. BT258]|uniref:histidine kinase n=1 Tax=Adhaeribacter terrigena TaxID=2793070 RepID=A0ABS1C4D4_9BACT|nr:ATP-binding protein [Adhaeribacter terrigena]MBK0404254.1 PAS domain S-box protein [Adhaeribacter terrigena]
MQEVKITLEDQIELLPDAVLIVNQKGKLVEVNLEVYTIFGYRPDELIGMDLTVLLPVRYRAFLKKYFKKYFENPTKRRMKSGDDLYGLRKNGKEIDINISLAPIEVGSETMAMAVIRDISEVKLLERVLLKKNEDLSLTNTQLERLGYIIAHDLKSPLLNIHALLTFLERELASHSTPIINGYIKDMKDISLSMMDLIAGVADYSRIGFQENIEQQVDLNLILKEVQALVHFPPNFRFIVIGPLPVIKGNKTKIIQVFLNLVNNAMKYNDKPEGIIEVRAEAGEKVCNISIADNGPGVPEELRKKIFELFRQGLVEQKGSQGIGLAVVKKIIESQGGTIRVETSRLGGADFIFTWPCT